MNDLISHKFQSALKVKLAKIYPLKSCEIRSLRILETGSGPAKPLAAQPKPEEPKQGAQAPQKTEEVKQESDVSSPPEEPKQEMQVQPSEAPAQSWASHVLKTVMDQFIIQGVGMFGLLFILLSFQVNKRDLILSFFIIAQVLFAVHYGLLEAWTAVVVNIIAAARTSVYRQKESKPWADNVLWVHFFAFLFVLSGIVFWEGVQTLLPVFACIVSCYALWLHNPRHIRFLMIITSPPWMVYSYLVGSFAGILAHVFIMTSLIIGIARFDLSWSANRIKD
jgi:hypothetical protein